MTLRRSIYCFGLVSALVVMSAGFASPAEEKEETEAPVFEAEKIIVVATGEPADPGTLPTSTSIITQTEIERSGAQNLMDLLVREPGVWVTRQGGMGFGGAVTIRGFGGSPPTQVAVTVDGHPSQMGIMGHILPTSYLVDNVERVEIMRGPAGTLHGNMALGGAINIVTRTAAEEEHRGSALAAAGTYDTRGEQLWIAGGGGATGYRAQWGRLSTDGDHPFARYRASNCSLALDQKLEADWEASFRAQQALYHAFDQREVADAYAAAREPRFLEQQFDRQDYDLQLTRRRPECVTGVKLYRTDGDHEFQDGFHSQDYGSGVMVWRGESLDRGWLRWGLDWAEYGGDIFSPQPIRSRFARREYAAHAVMDHEAGAKARVSAGARYTDPEGFDAEWLPELGVVRSLQGGWSLFGSARRGYRTPSFRELFLFGINNPDLHPEEAWQYEAGVRRSFTGGGRLEASVFRIDAANLIVLRPRPGAAPGESPVQWANAGDAVRDGFEVSLRKPLGARTAAYANFSYLSPGQIREQTVGRKLAAGLDHRIGRLLLSGDIQYVSRLFDFDQTNTLVEVPSFAIVNLKGTAEARRGVRFGLVVENLFDRRYRLDPAYPYPMPGRSIRLQVEQDW